MSNKTISRILLALITSLAAITPVLAQYYVNPYGGPYGGPFGSPYGYPYGYPYHQPYYNNYAYRGYAPYYAYGYVPRRYHRWHRAPYVPIGAGIGAGVGAAVGLFAFRHGHRYYED